MRRIRGFTLLEILVAFVILALLGGSLMQLFQGGLRNIDSSQHITHAALLARSKLSELQAVSQLSDGDYEGRFDDTYHWTLQVERYVEDDGEPLPESALKGLHAKLTVHWKPSGSYRIDTLLLTPGEQP